MHHLHENKITNVIMLTTPGKWHENISTETNCILLAKYLQTNKSSGP